MLKKANRGEIPAEIANPGRTMRRYTNTPKLRQWCTRENIDNQLRRELARQVSPISIDAVRFIQRLHRAGIDFHRLITRRPLSTWSLFELDKLLQRIQYIETTMRIPVEKWMEAKRFKRQTG